MDLGGIGCILDVREMARRKGSIVDFVDEFLTLIEALNERQVDYVLIGGAALNVHGLIRATEDVDIFIAPERANVERLKEALDDVWSDPSIDDIDPSELLGDFPVVRYGPPRGTMYVDIATRIGERTSYEDLEWELVRLRGVDIRVASPRSLYDMKVDTVRPIDRADARTLARAFDFEEE